MRLRTSHLMVHQGLHSPSGEGALRTHLKVGQADDPRVAVARAPRVRRRMHVQGQHARALTGEVVGGGAAERASTQHDDVIGAAVGLLMGGVGSGAC